MGNHSGKYVIRETEYAAEPFCSADMPSWPLTWSITPRHDMLKCHKPAGNSSLSEEDWREILKLLRNSKQNGYFLVNYLHNTVMICSKTKII